MIDIVFHNVGVRTIFCFEIEDVVLRVICIEAGIVIIVGNENTIRDLGLTAEVHRKSQCLVVITSRLNTMLTLAFCSECW